MDIARTDPPAATGNEAIALAVDLDGSLLKTDLLFESALALIAERPWMALRFPLWLMRGKARLKREIASRVELDVAVMPFDGRVLDLVRAAAGKREVVLCTAGDAGLARQVADHVGGFDAVLASDGERNLAGVAKRDALDARFGERGYDYVGNAPVDLAIWRHARHAIVANAPASLAAAAARVTTVAAHLPAEGRGPSTWLRAIRLHQWIKNLLVLVPLLAAHRFTEPEALRQSALGFLAFCLCASGVYVLNDLLDLAADRHHPTKRLRPFASGQLPLAQGVLLAPLLSLAGFAIALWQAPGFAAVLLAYYLLTLAYSFRLKRRAVIDVMVLAGLYTLRIIGGALLLATAPSFWLLAFSVFLFLSLATLKRHKELLSLLEDGGANAKGRGYRVDDLPMVQSFGTASGYQAVLVLALYINSPASQALYRRPELLWVVCPVLLYWITRAWMIAHRGLMRDDPVVFAATDRVSIALVLFTAAVVLCAI
jgi:4-hydroxybenzoate polyprenyltransferase